MSNASSSARQAILERAQSIVGAKGFSAVGLNEILQAAQVPKGSFYHYFNSKDAFGVVLLDTYFDQYVEGMQQLLDQPGSTHHAKLMRYWQGWIDNHTGCTDAGKCLAVKLGAEVSDLSEPMRLALQTRHFAHHRFACRGPATRRRRRLAQVRAGPRKPGQALVCAMVGNQRHGQDHPYHRAVR